MLDAGRVPVGVWEICSVGANRIWVGCGWDAGEMWIE